MLCDDEADLVCAERKAMFIQSKIRGGGRNAILCGPRQSKKCQNVAECKRGWYLRISLDASPDELSGLCC